MGCESHIGTQIFITTGDTMTMSQPQKALVIWNTIPESIEIFLIPDPTEEELEMLAAASGNYINSKNENEAAERLSALLGDQWERHKVDVPLDLSGDVRVFESGFVM